MNLFAILTDTTAAYRAANGLPKLESVPTVEDSLRGHGLENKAPKLLEPLQLAVAGCRETSVNSGGE